MAFQINTVYTSVHKPQRSHQVFAAQHLLRAPAVVSRLEG